MKNKLAVTALIITISVYLCHKLDHNFNNKRYKTQGNNPALSYKSNTEKIAPVIYKKPIDEQDTDDDHEDTLSHAVDNDNNLDEDFEEDRESIEKEELTDKRLEKDEEIHNYDLEDNQEIEDSQEEIFEVDNEGEKDETLEEEELDDDDEVSEESNSESSDDDDN